MELYERDFNQISSNPEVKISLNEAVSTSNTQLQNTNFIELYNNINVQQQTAYNLDIYKKIIYYYLECASI
jgi:hypothetical protein